MSSSLEEKFGSLQEFQTKNPKIQVIISVESISECPGMSPEIERKKAKIPQIHLIFCVELKSSLNSQARMCVFL